MKTITMTDKEVVRFDTINNLINKKIRIGQAMKILSLSKRQIKRLRKRVRESGTEGVVHLARGKPSNRKTDEVTKKKAEVLLTETYHDFGPTFASEKLREDHSIILSKETIRMMMIGLNLRTVSKLAYFV